MQADRVFLESITFSCTEEECNLSRNRSIPQCCLLLAGNLSVLGMDSEERMSFSPDYADSLSAHLQFFLAHVGASVAHLLLLQGQGGKEHQAFNPHVNDSLSTWH